MLSDLRCFICCGASRRRMVGGRGSATVPSSGLDERSDDNPGIAMCKAIISNTPPFPQLWTLGMHDVNWNLCTAAPWGQRSQTTRAYESAYGAYVRIAEHYHKTVSARRQSITPVQGSRPPDCIRAHVHLVAAAAADKPSSAHSSPQYRTERRQAPRFQVGVRRGSRSCSGEPAIRPLSTIVAVRGHNIGTPHLMQLMWVCGPQGGAPMPPQALSWETCSKPPLLGVEGSTSGRLPHCR